MTILSVIVLVLLSAAPVLASEPSTCATCTPPNLNYAAQKAVEDAKHTDSRVKRRKILEKGLHWANTCVTKFPEDVSCREWKAELERQLHEKPAKH